MVFLKDNKAEFNIKVTSTHQIQVNVESKAICSLLDASDYWLHYTIIQLAAY